MRSSSQPDNADLSSRSALGWAALAVLFCYLLFVRTHGVSTTFWLAGDQERDWFWALAPLRELRLAGVPSNAGGTTLGPVWIWTLWLIHHIVSPWTGNLPHGAAIGVAVIQSLADAFLFAAIWKKTRSWWLAFLVVLLAATQPLDISLTRTLWNTELAVALVKVTIGLVLGARERPSPGSVAAIAAAAWLAAQTHSIAIFLAAPLLVSLVLVEAIAGRYRDAFARARLIAEVVLILQIPFFINLVRHPSDAAAPSAVIGGVLSSLHHPGSLAPVQGVATLIRWWALSVMSPWTATWFTWPLFACFGAAVVRVRKDLLLASVTVLPLAAFAATFVVSQVPVEGYFVLEMIPVLALTVGLGLTAWRPAARPLAVVGALIVLAAQPARVASGLAMQALPEYGALVKGSAEILRRSPTIQYIGTTFTLPASTDPEYLYVIMGGRIAPTSRYWSQIRPDGSVTFTLVTP